MKSNGEGDMEWDRVHTASHCNTLQHTATHCNTLQHTTTHPHPSSPWISFLAFSKLHEDFRNPQTHIKPRHSSGPTLLKLCPKKNSNPKKEREQNQGPASGSRKEVCGLLLQILSGQIELTKSTVTTNVGLKRLCTGLAYILGLIIFIFWTLDYKRILMHMHSFRQPYLLATVTLQWVVNPKETLLMGWESGQWVKIVQLSFFLCVEFWLKTDSGYPKDTGDTLFTLETPGNPLRYDAFVLWVGFLLKIHIESMYFRVTVHSTADNHVGPY